MASGKIGKDSSCYGYSKERIDEIHNTLPCRESQISTLLALFGKPSHAAYSSIFIYGHTASGKSAVITTILQTLQLPHAIVNCVECYTQRLLYEHILNQVGDVIPSPDNNYSCYARCDNMNDFVRLLKNLIEEKELGSRTLFIVLDKAERLRDMDANILPALLRLQELSNCNICVILISEIVLEKFRTGTGFHEPFVLHFPDYSKDEMLEIISHDCPSDYSPSFYISYVNLLMSIFYMVCRDLNELRHLAQLNFPKYIEPILKGEATVENAPKLWRNIQPHLQKALQTIYLREVSSAQWEKYQLENVEGAGSLPNLLSLRSSVELPYYSKYLLIAAYLASYNPTRTDKRFFSKHHGKINKHKLKKTEKISFQLLGPKPFPLERLMAIFYSIVEGKVAPTANIFSQISSLVSLHLVSHVSSDDQLDSAKYKCTVSLDFIRSIARTVNFDVVRYLYDFV
uniref:Origin recognition complex subunit 5-like n=1 Tax=Saccoglossus kowalevskii TaxID=10224 RepID=A0ABM0GYL7_SACKO|nr:PREDICTED: origin recognition complex subunit 5-like [Saccoglossus kowalevskii]